MELKQLVIGSLLALSIDHALALSSAPTPLSDVPAPTGADGATFPAVTNFSGNGPFNAVEFVTESCVFYHPATPGADGVRHPVVIWGNGTGATTAIYRPLLRHLATHGFVVAAATTQNSGTGTEMRHCLDEAALENADINSVLHDTLNTTRVGAAGHSQGGGGTLMAGIDERVTATAPIQPYILGLGHDQTSLTQQQGAMLLLAGTADALVIPEFNQDTVFAKTNVPVFYANQEGTGHFAPLFDGGDYRELITAWFRFYLMDDQGARAMFMGSECELCVQPDWIIRKKNLD